MSLTRNVVFFAFLLGWILLGQQTAFSQGQNYLPGNKSTGSSSNSSGQPQTKYQPSDSPGSMVGSTESVVRAGRQSYRLLNACMVKTGEVNPLLSNTSYMDTIYTFYCDTLWQVPNNTETGEIWDVGEVLIVAGGGGGGRGTSAGGGGAGGLIYINTLTLTPGETISVTVGEGGTGATSTNARGINGGNSTFGLNVAIGGGGGGSTDDGQRVGGIGGSGGGSAHGGPSNNGFISGGVRIVPPIQGNNGGDGRRQGNSMVRAGGGGGGINGEGDDGIGGQGGNGGAGIQFAISGSDLYYAAGGGGVGTNGNGQGGSNIGGDGNGVGAARDGQGITGSGGGAGSTLGGNGADGVVIVRQTFRILPVEFLYVDVNFKRESRASLLAWATGKEWNNSHFEVQRSEDGLKTWKTLDSVPGTGWSDSKTEYQYIDEFPPLAGGLVYYRLRQVDLDGKSAYSKVMSLRVPKLLETKGSWAIFPNPLRNETIRIELMDSQVYQGEEVVVKVIHSMGQAQTSRGSDLDALESWLSGVFSRGQRGLYVVEISWGKYREYHKVLSRD